jgi:hypothetical protein
LSEEQIEWYFKGDWVETCGSPPICPAYFLSPFPRGCCEGVMTMNIAEGKYGNVDISGTIISIGFVTPEGKTIMEGMGGWKGILYIGQNANDEQVNALEKIFTKIWSGFGELLKIKRTEINFTKKIVRKGPAAKFNIEIPGIFLLKTKPLMDMAGKPTKVVNSPMVDGIIYVAASKINEYKDKDLPRTWSYKNLSSTYFNIKVDSKENMIKSIS